MLKIRKGRKYICTKTVTINEEVAFIEGDIYVSLKDDHLIDINGVHRNLGVMQLECFELKTIDNHGYWEKLWHDYTIKIFCNSLQTPEIQKILISGECSYDETGIELKESRKTSSLTFSFYSQGSLIQVTCLLVLCTYNLQLMNYLFQDIRICNYFHRND